MTKVNPPSKISENQKNLCMTIIKKLRKQPYAVLIEEFPEENFIPIDLKRIQAKLELNQYSRVEEFKDDMNSTVKNLQKLLEKNPKAIPRLNTITLDFIKTYVKKHIDRISRNESDQAYIILSAKYQKLKELLDNRPRPIKHPKIVLKPPS